jgi:hypothetical protein
MLLKISGTISTMNIKKINLVYVTFLFPFFFSFGFWLLYHIKQPIDQSFLLSHVNEFGIQSTKLQLLFYTGLIGALGMVCLSVLLSAKNNFPKEKLLFPAPNENAVVVFLLAPFLFGEFSMVFAICLFSVFLILQSAGKFCTLPFIKRIPLRSLSGVIILFWLIAFYIIPTLGSRFIVSGTTLSNIESHYAMTVLPGYDFAQSGMFERSNYGFSMVILSALACKIESILGAQDMQLIFAVKGCQIIAISMLLFAIYLLNKKHFLFISAVMLIATPALSTLSEAIDYPNQSGIRYIPLFIGIVLMAYEMRREKQRLLLFSTVSALLILMSPEEGVVLSLGFLVFLVLKKYKPEAACRTTFKTAGLFFALTAIIFTLFYTFFCQLFYKSTSVNIFSFIKIFASGYGGLVGQPNVLATFVVFFGGVALVRGVLRARNGKVSSIDAYQAGVGAIMLAWLPYYVNRMAEWNLWVQASLLLLLFAPRIDFSFLRILSRKDHFCTLYISLGVSLMGAHMIFSTVQSWAPHVVRYCRVIGSRPVKAASYGDQEAGRGYRVVCVDAPEIAKQLGFLEGITEKNDYLIISKFPTQIRLMGFNKNFPWYDPFGEIPRVSDFNSLIDWIETRGPHYLMIDDPASSISMEKPNHTQHFQQIVNSLPFYRKHKTDSGWVIYERMSSLSGK